MSDTGSACSSWCGWCGGCTVGPRGEHVACNNCGRDMVLEEGDGPLPCLTCDRCLEYQRDLEADEQRRDEQRRMQRQDDNERWQRENL